MSSFTDPLEVSQNPITGKWRTLRTMSFYHDGERGQETFVIPMGTCTDFASIPRILWTLVGHPAGRYAQAAVLHDYLYQRGVVSRARADALFLEAMTVLKVRRTQRWALYLGVRMGGWVSWSKHRRRDATVRRVDYGV